MNVPRESTAKPTTPDQNPEKAQSRPLSRSGSHSRQRPGSHRRTRSVVDEGQTGITPLTTHIAGIDGLLHPEIAAFPLHTPHVVETVIPPSRTGSSTRPTHAGIAYPFKLKVEDGEGKEEVKNPSMITLEGDEDEQLTVGGVDEALDNLNRVQGQEKERPKPERFVTAAEML